jgi:hypothetical protein
MVNKFRTTNLNLVRESTTSVKNATIILTVEITVLAMIVLISLEIETPILFRLVEPLRLQVVVSLGPLDHRHHRMLGQALHHER